MNRIGLLMRFCFPADWQGLKDGNESFSTPCPPPAGDTKLTCRADRYSAISWRLRYLISRIGLRVYCFFAKAVTRQHFLWCLLYDMTDRQDSRVKLVVHLKSELLSQNKSSRKKRVHVKAVSPAGGGRGVDLAILPRYLVRKQQKIVIRNCIDFLSSSYALSAEASTKTGCFRLPLSAFRLPTSDFKISLYARI